MFDPDHEFLCERPQVHWSTDELPVIFKFAPCCVDRAEAMRQLLSNHPTDDTVIMVVEGIRADTDVNPSFTTIDALAKLARKDLRPFFEELLNHANFARRAEAIQALGLLPINYNTTEKIRGLINYKAPIPVVVAAIQVLAKWNKEGNIDVFKKALLIPSHGDVVKAAAEAALKP